MEEATFNELIRKNSAIISRICRAYTNGEEEFKDYFQEVSIQLWRSLKSFRGEAQPSTWVYRVTLNVCLTQQRKNSIDTVPLQNYDQFEDEVVEKEETIQQLYRALKKLPEPDRAVILLYLEDKSYKEMAEILGISISHVGVKLNRIKAQLKKMLNGNG
ncbi:MAG TPA: RNA polymerase [Cytophagales bacterium]|jgi:RNA polymerase sigma-70 factor (ECF subfamily)|nr:RNA polymerase [Cytophagales bacterium]